jgi:threonine/homoserine/homoserine lactone efflux protein
MFDLHPILLAALAGFVTALVFSSIPVGPVNLTIINEGAQRGFGGPCSSASARPRWK